MVSMAIGAGPRYEARGNETRPRPSARYLGRASPLVSLSLAFSRSRRRPAEQPMAGPVWAPEAAAVVVAAEVEGS